MKRFLLVLMALLLIVGCSTNNEIEKPNLDLDLDSVVLSEAPSNTAQSDQAVEMDDLSIWQRSTGRNILRSLS